MKSLRLIGLACTLSLIGCATVVDRDFEKEEQDFIKQHGQAAKDPFFAPATPNDVIGANEDNIRVTIHKSKSDKVNGLELQNWKAVLTNDSEEDKCVAVLWKLMDFQLVTHYPEFLYLTPHQQILDYAELKQQIWNMDGTKFALPPSGYIQQMVIKEPNIKNKLGEECVFENEKVEEQ